MPSLPAWLEPFSPPFREAVLSQLSASAPRRVAAFDADGTLWNEDIGEAFFRWLAAGGLLSGMTPDDDPFAVWEEYEARVARNRAEGYAWAVQRMAGLAEEDVRRWSRQMAVAWPNYRPEMLGLVRGLSASGFEVWLVSASNAWIIGASAPIVGVDEARVLGIRVAVEDRRLTERLVPPVTCNAGKVEAVRTIIGAQASLAFGDSMGDFEMLEDAKQALVVGRREKPGAEIHLQAERRGWPVHLF